MLQRLTVKLVAVLLFMAVSSVEISAQDVKPVDINKAAHWSDVISGVEVYLFHKGNQTYRLAVVSDREVKVVYRTSINSMEPVVKELAPVESVGGAVNYFEFDHYFSKMTIWMALEFTVEGKLVPGLTRAFYDDIFTLVPPNHYFGAPKKKVALRSMNDQPQAQVMR